MRWSIRRLSIAVAIVFAILGIAETAAFALMATSLRHATEVVVRDTESAHALDAVERILVTDRRLREAERAAPAPELSSLRAQVDRNLDDARRRAVVHAASPEERERLLELGDAIDEYLRASDALGEAGATAAAGGAARTASFDRIADSLESLRDLNEAQVRAAVAEARRLDTMSDVLAIVSVLALLVVVAGLTFLAHRTIVRPFVTLDAAVRREGETRFDIDPHSPRELVSLASTLRHTARALAAQRQRELAFVAGVVHDVRNPLNGMKLGIQVARENPDPALLERTLAMLDRQVDRLSRMLGDLLDSTRIASGELELRTERFDLARVAREVVRLWAPTSARHHIVFRAPDAPLVMRGDALRIEQVITNLVSNAIKYSPAGGEVTVALRVDQGDAVIEVTDEGIGIEPERAEALFDPFRRAASDVAPGAGLGLSVVRRIANAHGGEVSVESRPGHGSTFRVRLPLAPRPDDESSMHPSPRPGFSPA